MTKRFHLTKKIIKKIISFCWPASNEKGISIIYYHSINPSSERGINPVLFKEHVEWLKENFEIIDLSALEKLLVSNFTNSNEIFDREKVMITFDDGYEDNYLYAYPILSELNIPATIFFVPGFAGKLPPVSSGMYKGCKMLSWKQLREMQRNGFSIQAHTYSHVDLTKLERGEIVNELIFCKNAIEQNLSKEVFAIAYPWGKFSHEVLHIAESIGYRIGFSTLYGKIINDSNTNIMRLPRLIVDSDDSVNILENKIAGKYGFLRLKQQISITKTSLEKSKKRK